MAQATTRACMAGNVRGRAGGEGRVHAGCALTRAGGAIGWGRRRAGDVPAGGREGEEGVVGRGTAFKRRAATRPSALARFPAPSSGFATAAASSHPQIAACSDGGPPEQRPSCWQRSCAAALRPLRHRQPGCQGTLPSTPSRTKPSLGGPVGRCKSGGAAGPPPGCQLGRVTRASVGPASVAVTGGPVAPDPSMQRCAKVWVEAFRRSLVVAQGIRRAGPQLRSAPKR